MVDVVIIGGGIGGAAAALRAAQNGMNAFWFLGYKKTRKQSRSQWVVNLDNIVGFHEDIIKNQTIKTLQKHKQEEAAILLENQHYHINNRMLIQNTIQRIETNFPEFKIIDDKVESLKNNENGFEITYNDETVFADAVILSTGVMDEQPRIKKQDKKGEWLESPKWIYPFLCLFLR